MSDDDDKKRQHAYNMAWQELKIRECLRQAAMVAHLRRHNGLRDQFIIVAGQTFDAVADELEETAKLRPEWPKDEAEFAIATADATVTTITGGEPAASPKDVSHG